MNFLQILQAAVREAGIAGGGPSDTQNQTGILGKFVDWGKDAWLEIQNEKKWDFLRGNKIVVLTATVNDYDIYGTNPGQLAWTDFSSMDTDSKIILTNVDGSKAYVTMLSWPEYRKRYGLVTSSSGGPPLFAVITPDNKLHFEPTPNAAHSVDFPYWKTPTALVTKTDTPVILAQWHMAIAWRTVQKFAIQKKDVLLHNKAIDQETTIYHQMMQKYLPPIECGPNPITG